MNNDARKILFYAITIKCRTRQKFKINIQKYYTSLINFIFIYHA